MKRLHLQIAKFEAGFEINTERKLRQGLIHIDPDAVVSPKEGGRGRLLPA